MAQDCIIETSVWVSMVVLLFGSGPEILKPLLEAAECMHHGLDWSQTVIFSFGGAVVSVRR